MPLVDIDVPETVIEADIQVWCGGCGAGLCHQAQASGHMGVSVEPCERCLATARDDGYAKGYDAAYEEQVTTSVVANDSPKK